MKKGIFFFLIFMFLYMPMQAEAHVTSKKDIYTQISKNFMDQKTEFSISCPYNKVVDSLVMRIGSSSDVEYYGALYEITDMADSAGSTNDGEYLYANLEEVYCYYADDKLIFYDVSYFETKQETEKVNKKIAKVAKQIKKKSKKRITQIRLAYEYVIKQVKYDYRKRANYSAYAGLFKNRTVCNGYAMILYKLLNKMDIPCKFISGTVKDHGKRYLHAWNIVKVKGKWYNLDACSDDADNGKKYKKYFMKNDKTFSKDHKKDAFLRTKEFKKKYPMASVNLNWKTIN